MSSSSACKNTDELLARFNNITTHFRRTIFKLVQDGGDTGASAGTKRCGPNSNLLDGGDTTKRTRREEDTLDLSRD
jgi:hypothetical protein